MENNKKFISPHAETFVKLLDLKPGWDSYNAKPIEMEAAVLADKFLRYVNIVPTARGGIQLEWHFDGLELEINFDEKGISEVMTSFIRK